MLCILRLPATPIFGYPNFHYHSDFMAQGPWILSPRSYCQSRNNVILNRRDETKHRNSNSNNLGWFLAKHLDITNRFFSSLLHDKFIAMMHTLLSFYNLFSQFLIDNELQLKIPVYWPSSSLISVETQYCILPLIFTARILSWLNMSDCRNSGVKIPQISWKTNRIKPSMYIYLYSLCILHTY